MCCAFTLQSDIYHYIYRELLTIMIIITIADKPQEDNALTECVCESVCKHVSRDGLIDWVIEWVVSEWVIILKKSAVCLKYKKSIDTCRYINTQTHRHNYQYHNVLTSVTMIKQTTQEHSSLS